MHCDKDLALRLQPVPDCLSLICLFTASLGLTSLPACLNAHKPGNKQLHVPMLLTSTG